MKKKAIQAQVEPVVRPIFGLIFDLSNQRKIIDEHCFKTCGKIIVGAINDKDLGCLMVCRTPKEQCPQLDKEMDEPFGEVHGEPLFIRKLKA